MNLTKLNKYHKFTETNEPLFLLNKNDMLKSGTENFYRPLNGPLVEEQTGESGTNVNYLAKFNNVPYCPVEFLGEDTNGGRHFKTLIKDTIEDIDKYIELLECLSTMTEKDTITIEIDSPGGYIHTGVILSTYVRDCVGTTITDAIGICASAGSLIWSSGKICKVSPLATFMWHMSSHADGGNSVAIWKNAEIQIEYVRDVLLKHSLDKGHITKQEIDKICTDVTEAVWITAPEMIERLENHTKQNENPDTEENPNENQNDFSTQTDVPETYINTNTSETATAQEALNGLELLNQQDKTTTKLPQRYNKLSQEDLVKLAGPMMGQQQIRGLQLIVYSTDNKQFRIYITAETQIEHPVYQNKLSMFLSCLPSDCEVILHLGNLINDMYPGFYLHGIIDAIQKCEAKVITYATGRCGMLESQLWLFGDEMWISPYGTLTFIGVEHSLKSAEMWRHYFEYIFKTGVEKNILTKEQYANLLLTNRYVNITFSDLKGIHRKINVA